MTEPGTTTSGGFDFNQPTIISLCYLGSFITGLSGLVGIILAHVWQGENQAEWAASHFTYLIRTFWIGLAVSVVLTITIIGMIALPLPMIWVAVRSVMSLIKAQKQEPMPDPKTLLF
jgi:uncharacterized membrane protein